MEVTICLDFMWIIAIFLIGAYIGTYIPIKEKKKKDLIDEMLDDNG